MHFYSHLCHPTRSLVPRHRPLLRLRTSDAYAGGSQIEALRKARETYGNMWSVSQDKSKGVGSFAMDPWHPEACGAVMRSCHEIYARSIGPGCRQPKGKVPALCSARSAVPLPTLQPTSLPTLQPTALPTPQPSSVPTSHRRPPP